MHGYNLVFATNNSNKLYEVQKLLGQNIKLLNLSDIGCYADLPETHQTLEENAEEKARYIYNNFKINCFADDTGLEVDALNNAPGVYSARYAGEEKNSEANMDKILYELNGEKNRKARFKTVIFLIINNETYTFKGIVNGIITTTKKGSGGFGYDPIFQPEGYNKTFAELSMEEKNKISHRAMATNKLIDFLTNNINILKPV